MIAFDLQRVSLVIASSFYRRCSNKLWVWLMCLLLVGLSVMWPGQAWAQLDIDVAKEVRTLYPSEWGVAHPAGIAYSTSRDHLLLLAKREPYRQGTSVSNIVVITPYEDLIGSSALPFGVDDAINIEYGTATEFLFLLDNVRDELAQVFIEHGGVPDAGTLIRFDISHLGLGHAAGLGMDSTNERLFILDSESSEIVIVGIDGKFSLLDKVGLSDIDVSSLRGLAVHPVSRNLFMMSVSPSALLEFTQSGQLVNTYDVTKLNLVDTGGIVFGASSDLTDAAETMHLFVADSNLQGCVRQPTYGRILEIALEPVRAAGQPVTAFQRRHGRDAEAAIDLMGRY